MDIFSIIGLVMVFVFTVVGIIWGGGELMSFVDASSIMITVGGSIAACMVQFSVKQIRQLPTLLRIAFDSSTVDLEATIDTVIELANMARREGLLALEEAVKTLGEPFLQKGIMLVVDGTDPELVKSIMETELTFLEDRHSKGVQLMDALGAYGPAYGMIGTLIGLINMLKNLSDPSSLGAGMATALVTTFYGSLLANGVFGPIGGKLKYKSGNEIIYKEMILEGVLSIQAGENPRIIETKLRSFLAKSLEKSGEEQAKGGE